MFTTKPISQKKWDTFSLKKKMELLKQCFLSLEKAICSKSDLTDILTRLLEITPLLEKETDDSLQKIYVILRDERTTPPPFMEGVGGRRDDVYNETYLSDPPLQIYAPPPGPLHKWRGRFLSCHRNRYWSIIN